ncbi:hypothetical protein PIB30_050221 [Stylosanthes scabra]|uniref:Ubiquitin-like protease family profile domain-containing protein n=1 Tax=Stylosanthes scabra TaxID=79078 RepID=A0ABU6XF79_9FABA|nr:hypothetical protein [Stylosanthes scabra]
MRYGPTNADVSLYETQIDIKLTIPLHIQAIDIKDTHKFFQGKSVVALTDLVQTTPLDTEDNRKLFMWVFILFIQKVFLLPNSTSSIVPTALTTIFDLETTSKRNRALRVHDFLLQELKKAKQNNSNAIHGCVYVLMIIYFHETHFGENSKEVEARRPWIAYWKSDTLKKRLKQERTHEAGLLKTGEMMAKKDRLKRKSPTMRVPPSKRVSESESESYKPSSNSEATESNLVADTEPEPESEPEHAAHEEPPPQREIRSKRRNDRAVVGSNTPVIITQQSVAEPGPIHSDQPSKSLDAEVDVPPLADDIQDATEPEPLIVVVPLQPEQQPEPGRTSEEPTEPIEVEPEPNTMNIPLEPELTLRPWLQDEAGTNVGKAPTNSADKMITNVLMSIKQEGLSTQIENQPQNEDQGQCRTLEAASVSMAERCFIWATTENNNKYETIFQLRGPNTQEAMRYNFMTMEPSSCIDMVMVSFVCHVLNREEVERYQRDVYCVPPEILTLMFVTNGRNYIDKKTKKPHLVTSLKDQEFMGLLDKEKLKTTSALYAPVVYSNHWWLYVLDVDHREFFIIYSIHGINQNQTRNKLHRFACNMLNQLKMWVGATSLMKKNTNTLQLRPVDVPRQPNPTDYGVYVMKWMELLDTASIAGAYMFQTRYTIEQWDQDQVDEFRKEIVTKVSFSEHNTLKMEAINQVRSMTMDSITEARERAKLRR